MRRSIAIALLSTLIGLEVAGTLALLWGVPARQLTGFAMGHGGASVLAMALQPLLPRAYRKGHARTGTLLLAAMVLLMPVFGLLGLLTVVLPTLHRPAHRRTRTWRRVSIGNLPVRPNERPETRLPEARLDVSAVEARPNVHAEAHPDTTAADRAPIMTGGRSLSDILHGSDSVTERVAAVLAVRHLPTRAAVPILRLALRDPADDVRLLAYAMLDRRDAALQSRIQALETSLAREPLAPGDAAAMHRTLARLHWELSYSGLATGAVEQRALDSAAAHARAALAVDAAADTAVDRGTLFLLGRILLRQGALREAEQVLTRARELGIAESSIRPFLAEIAFLERRFAHVRAHLDAGGRDQRPGIASDLGRFWLPEAA